MRILGQAPSLDWLFGLEQFGIKLGLANITTILEALDHPERAAPAVHIAGTNGKGSVAAMTEAALRAAGHRTGRYTSPHLIDLTERFAVDGQPVSTDALVSAVADIRALVDRLRAEGRLDVDPTFFEVTTAAAFELFRRAAVTVAVCEVGLGGRLDATNVLRPVACTITSIGLDHQQHLGTTLGAIAIEKAGIIKPATPVIVGRMAPEALAGIRGVAAARGAPLVEAWDGVEVERLDIFRVRPDQTVTQIPTRIRLRTPRRDYGQVAIALPGDHQIDNAVVAVRLLEAIDSPRVPVPGAAVVRGLKDTRWPGRLDARRLPDGREVLVDAAHNPDGATALAAYLTSKSKDKRPLVFGAARDKDVDRMLRALAPTVSAIVFTKAANPRSADPAELAARAKTIAPGLAIAVEPSPRDALAEAWTRSPRIIVAGSIFLVGDVMKEYGWS